MMLKLSVSLILLAGLMAISVSGSAIKGHHQTQPVQRAEELPKGSLKSPVSQQTERNPKSVPVASHPATPVLESSKKVYNDVSFRRSVGQQQQAADQQQAQPQSTIVAKSSPAVEPAASVQQPVVNQPAASVVAPVQGAPVPFKDSVSSQEAPKVVAVPAQAPAPAPAPALAPAPVDPVVKPVEASAVPASKPSDELPPQSDRSAPVKEEVKAQVANSSPVAVEQVVEPVQKVAVAPQQQAPVVSSAESRPVAPVVQPVPSVVQSQPEPVVEPHKPAVVDSSLQAKKDEPAPAASVKDSNEHIEVPAPDPGLVLSEPIDSTTKLLIDLDEHVQKFLPTEDKQEPAQPAKEAVLVQGVDYSPAQPQASDSQPSGKSSVPLMPYSSNVENEPIVPPLPSSLDKVEKASGAQSAPPSSTTNVANGQSATRQANHQHQNQQQVITQLLDQLDSLQNRIQDTINQLVARRRYVMSALLRPMGTYVRRVRTNLERLQNRVNQLQAAASSVGGTNNPNHRPGGFVDAAAIETIRRRIDDISKRISDIVTGIRMSMTPTSAPLNNNGRK